MNKLIALTVATLLTLTSGLALAAHHGHGAHGAMHAESKSADPLPLVEAEVRRVDAAQNKLALRHGAIPNLDIPPMSMVFQIADPALLDGLKAGDRLQVTIDEIDSAYTVLSVKRAQP